MLSEPCPSRHDGRTGRHQASGQFLEVQPPPEPTRPERGRGRRETEVFTWSHGARATRRSGPSYESSARQKEPPAMGRTSPTLRRAWPKDGPLAAICVQSVDVQCVLQFTLVHAAGCVLHRRTSRVIHRLKLCSVCFLFHARGVLPRPRPTRGLAGEPAKARQALEEVFTKTKTELRNGKMKKARGRPPYQGAAL